MGYEEKYQWFAEQFQVEAVAKQARADYRMADQDFTAFCQDNFALAA